MDITEAIKYLKRGYKVQAHGFSNDEYIYHVLDPSKNENHLWIFIDREHKRFYGLGQLLHSEFTLFIQE